MRLDVFPELVPGARVGGQGDGARVRVLHGDLVAELEVEEVAREDGRLDAAEGLQDDFFAVDAGGVRVFGFEQGVGVRAAVGDGDAEDGEAEGGVDWGGGGGEVGGEAVLGFGYGPGEGRRGWLLVGFWDVGVLWIWLWDKEGGGLLLMACKSGGADEQSAELSGEKVLVWLEFPADLFRC